MVKLIQHINKYNNSDKFKRCVKKANKKQFKNENREYFVGTPDSSNCY